MTEQELKERLSQIEKDYELAKKNAYIDYAASNNPYKIGDIIKDHIITLKIKGWTYYIAWGKSECVYNGEVLRSDGKPAKNQNQVIYQSNILTKQN